MYKVIGGDQKEYGSLSADQVKGWVSEKRLNGQSRIQVEGAAGWQTLSELPEFAEALSAPPKPLEATPPAMVQPAKPKTSGLAIASLVLGPLGVLTCGLSSLVGLVLGVIALIKISKSQGRLTGTGFALGGICASGLILLMVPIAAAVALPALAKAKGKAQNIHCMNNVKQLELALIMFADDNDGQLPPANGWCDAIRRYTGGSREVFRCASQPGQECTYALNAKLEGKKLSELSSPGQTVMVFESNAGMNKAGGPEIAARNHSGRFLCVGFADGHVEIVEEGRLESLRWDP